MHSVPSSTSFSGILRAPRCHPTHPSVRWPLPFRAAYQSLTGHAWFSREFGLPAKLTIEGIVRAKCCDLGDPTQHRGRRARKYNDDTGGSETDIILRSGKTRSTENRASRVNALTTLPPRLDSSVMPTGRCYTTHKYFRVVQLSMSFV